jgi:hypothetical protein
MVGEKTKTLCSTNNNLFKMPILLPRIHINGACSKAFRQFMLFSKPVFDELQYGLITYVVSPSIEEIKFSADSAISLIYHSGLQFQARRQLGPQWETKVKQAIYVDFFATYDFVTLILTSSNIFWEQTEVYFRNFPGLPGTQHFIELMSASQRGFTIPLTRINLSYSFVLNQSCIPSLKKFRNESFTQQEIAALDAVQWRSREHFGVIKQLEELIPGFKVVTKISASGVKEPACVGDLINDKDKNMVYILNSEGVSTLSLAYNILFKTELVEPYTTFSLLKMCYMSIPNPEIKSEIRACITEIWLGVPYAMGEIYPSEPLQHPSGQVPSGPQNDGSSTIDIPPSSSQGPDVGPYPEDYEGPPSTEPVSPGSPDTPPNPSSSANNDSEILLKALDTSIELQSEVTRVTDTIDRSSSVGKTKRLINTLSKLVNNSIPLINLGLVSAILLHQNPEYSSTTDSTSATISTGPFSVSRSKGKAKSIPIRRTAKVLN